MIVSTTIALLATLLGSSILKKSSGQSSDSDNQKSSDNDSAQSPIKMGKRERLLYHNLCEVILKEKSVLALSKAVRDIEQILLVNGNLYGNENETIAYPIINQRFIEYLDTEDSIKSDESYELRDKWKRLEDYIEFLFVRNDLQSMTDYYKRSVKDAVIDVDIHRERLEKAFRNIEEANNNVNNPDWLSKHNYCYYDLLNETGNIYEELVYVNNSSGLIPDKNVFQSTIVTEIAETILNNTNFYFNKGLTKTTLSHDIKEHLINYFHHDQHLLGNGETIDSLVIRMRRNFFENREIRNYYYFLILCSRFVYTFRLNRERGLLLADCSESDFYKKVQKELFKVIKDYDFKFLIGLNDKEIWKHILATKPENDKQYEK